MQVEDLVGPQEIAQRLGVERSTIRQWRHRYGLPEPLLVLSGVPTWNWPDIEGWAKETGRPKLRVLADPGLPQEPHQVPRVEPDRPPAQAGPELSPSVQSAHLRLIERAQRKA